MRFDSVLVLGAHPDDEMGCAGLIYRLRKEGASVRIVTFSKCKDLNDGEQLTEEWFRAISALGDGIEVRLEDLPNRRLPEYRQSILDLLDEEHARGFDLVLCPATLDSHQDHAAVTAETKRRFKNTTVLGYELPFNHVGLSKLDVFAPLSMAAMGAKRAHAQQYHSQEHKAYMKPAYIDALARVRGVQSGRSDNAEAFEVIRWIL